MTTTEPRTRETATAAPKVDLLAQVGGWQGMLYSTLPVVVFVVANAMLTLPVTIGVSVGVAVALAAWRMWRGEKLASAAGGVIAVGVAGGLVAWTGSARDFFLLGIWVAAAGAVVTLASLLARRPVTGLIWNAVHGNRHDWRADRPTLRAHDLATIAAFVVFAARFVVTQWLYTADATGGLAVAKIAMGTPLTIVMAAVVVWAFRRSSKRLLTSS
jgi:hypothetical protein